MAFSTLLSGATVATMAGPDPYGRIDDGAVLVEDGMVAWNGAARDAPAADRVMKISGVLTPGLIDCHTHLVYAGNRADEFEKRLNGVSYADIARAGGGIVASVRATRGASEADLIAQSLPRLDCLLGEGVTTVEIKSGYGLDVAAEARMLSAARALGRSRPVTVVTSFLGAHAFPPEFKDDRAGYVRLVCEEALPAVVAEGLADAVDGFCEGIAFSVDEMEAVFAAAGRLGLPVKLHAEQLSNLGGAVMAARHKALSVDHIEYLDEAGVAAIAASGTVATLLPGAFYYLREKQAPRFATAVARAPVAGEARRACSTTRERRAPARRARASRSPSACSRPVATCRRAARSA
jgi:imidazolonepropionase